MHARKNIVLVIRAHVLQLAKIENNQYQTVEMIDVKQKMEEKLQDFQELWSTADIQTTGHDINSPLHERVLSFIELFQGRLHDFIEEGLIRGGKYLPPGESDARTQDRLPPGRRRHRAHRHLE